MALRGPFDGPFSGESIKDGKAKLVAYWWLRRGKDVLSAHQFAEDRALAADGYAALVAAEQALLTELAKNIAATLVTTEP
jgi:uncharacterized lipoprotein YmbA